MTLSILNLPKYGKTDRSIARLTFTPMGGGSMPYKEDDDTYLNFGMLQQWKHPDKRHTELIAHKIDDGSVLWSRTFEGDAPGTYL